MNVSNPASPQASSQYRQQDITLTETISSLRAALAAFVDKTLRLLMLESRLAALSLSTMLLLAVVVALLLVSAWLLVLAASAFWLVGLGWAWELALLAGAGLNILLTFPVMHLIRYLSRQLTFPASRRQLKRSLAPDHVHPDSA